MFSSPFFSGPATSRFAPQYVYRDSPQAYYDSPFEFSGEPMYSRASFLQRPHPSFTARPAAQYWRDEYESNSDSAEDSSEDDTGEPQPGYFSLAGNTRDTCTCGRCHEPAAQPSASRLLGNGMPAADGRRGNPRQGKPAAAATRPVTRASAAAAAAERLSSAPTKRASSGQSSEVKSDERATAAARRTANRRVPATNEKHAEPQPQHSAPAEPGQSTTEDEELERRQVLASFTAVMSIAKEIETLRQEVEQFSGGRKTKDFLRLEDTLTRVMLRLDLVESHGDDKIRSCRRKAIVDAQFILELLESKVSATAMPVASSQSSSAVSNDDAEESALDNTADDSVVNSECSVA